VNANLDEVISNLWAAVQYSKDLRRGVASSLNAVKEKEQVEWCEMIEKSVNAAISGLGETI